MKKYSESAPSLIVLVIPDIPPTPGRRGLTVTRGNGKLVIAEGSETPMPILELDEERARQVHAAISTALETKLYLPPPEGEEVPYWERELTPEEALAKFAEIKAYLKGEKA